MLVAVGLFLAHLVALSSSEHSLRGSDRLGSSQRKHAPQSKPKLHYSSSLPHVANKYGVDLPAFAFDYSEFIAGAVIERGLYSSELYLTIHLVGHNAVRTDFPFHAISTDEEVMNAWSRAVKKWDTDMKVPAAHSTQAPSGLTCVLQNNDGSSNQVYQSSAYWVHSQHESDPGTSSNTFAMLRCRLKSTAFVVANVTRATDRELFVDLMRTNPHKRGSGHRNTTSSTGHAPVKSVPSTATVAVAGRRLSTTNSGGGEATIATDLRGTVLSSFSVPWATRVVGYPMQRRSSNASALDMWADADSPPTAARSVGSGGSGGDRPAPVPYPPTAPEHSAYLCVPSIRPLHPERAEVGMPMLLEFIEHHLQLGFAHIALGLALDWHSPYMSKHLHILRRYIQSDHVSVHSTTLPGFDDAPGFAGVQLNDAYAAQFFVNQCLYLAKGMARYVTVLNPEQYITPASVDNPTSGGGSMGSSFVDRILTQFERVGANITTTSRTRSGRGAHSGGGGNSNTTAGSAVHPSTYCSFTLGGAASEHSRKSDNSSNSSPGRVTGDLDVYGVEDPANVLGAWGPGEREWGREFFASSALRLLRPDVSLAVHFLPTDRVVRIEVAPSGQVSGYCRHGGAAMGSTGGRGAGPGAGASANAAAGSGTRPLAHGAHGSAHAHTQSAGGSSRLSRSGAVSYTARAALPGPSQAALFIYKGSFPASQIAAGSNGTSAALLKQYLASRTALNAAVGASLKLHGLGSIKEVREMAKQAALVHASQAAVRMAERHLHHGDLAHHIASTAKTATGAATGAEAVLPTGADIKPPFWQLCNTDYLRDVIRRVFHAV